MLAGDKSKLSAIRRSQTDAKWRNVLELGEVEIAKGTTGRGGGVEISSTPGKEEAEKRVPRLLQLRYP